MWKKYIIFFLCCSFPVLGIGSPCLLPLPQKYTLTDERFELGEVCLSGPVLQEQWKKFIEEKGGKVVLQGKNRIEVRLVAELEEIPVNQDEAYRLQVTSRKIVVEATTERGIYWAMQTLAQLAVRKGKKIYFQGCTIADWPAFRVRGFMHDVGRGYVSVEELKREIAMLSCFKVNVFHWHLTENQAWRLESKRFPELNDSVNMTRFPGKYYTLEEARELVEYCKAHQVLLIPEVDMPGHSAAFVRAFGFR